MAPPSCGAVETPEAGGETAGLTASAGTPAVCVDRGGSASATAALSAPRCENHHKRPSITCCSGRRPPALRSPSRRQAQTGDFAQLHLSQRNREWCENDADKFVSVRAQRAVRFADRAARAGGQRRRDDPWIPAAQGRASAAGRGRRARSADGVHRRQGLRGPRAARDDLDSGPAAQAGQRVTVSAPGGSLTSATDLACSRSDSATRRSSSS